MIKAVSLLFVIALGAAPAPRVHVVSLPRTAIKGTPWRAVITVAPPTRATLRATGPGTLNVRLKPLKKRGRYQAQVRFPFAGEWRIAVKAGKRTARLGTVAVDVPKDPLVEDPITIAAEPAGSLVVGQLRAAPLLRIAHARAAKIGDGPGFFHVYVAGETVYGAGRDG